MSSHNRTVLGTNSLAEMLSERWFIWSKAKGFELKAREQIARQLTADLERATDKWGIHVLRCGRITQIHKAGKWGINVLRCNEEIAQFVFQTFISIAGWRSRMCAWLEKCNEWWPLKLRLQEMLGPRWKCWTFQQTLTKSTGDPQRGWEKSSESFDWSRLALGTEFGLPTSSIPAGWHLWYRTSEMMMVAD